MPKSHWAGFHSIIDHRSSTHNLLSLAANCGWRVTRRGLIPVTSIFVVFFGLVGAGMSGSAFSGLSGSKALAWLSLAGEQERQSDEIWQDEAAGPMAARQGPLQAEDRRYLRMSRPAMAALLAQAPAESIAGAGATDREVELPLPMPDGSSRRFRVVESSVMDAALAAKYPEIRTYSGESIDEPGVTMRCDLTPQGFHATILLQERSVSIHREIPGQEMVGRADRDDAIAVAPPPEAPAPDDDPYADRYVSYFGTSAIGDAESIVCDAGDPLDGPGEIGAAGSGTGLLDYLQTEAAVTAGTSTVSYNTGGTLRTFRLAMAANWEYSNTFGGGTNAGTVASMVTWLNGVNTVYEREIAVRLLLIDAPTILYTTERGFNSASDPFTNGSTGTMLGQLGSVMAGLGATRFDVGHVLGTGGGGVAYVGVVCRDATISGGPVKGLGVSLVGGSLGNSGGMYVLTHELGHQFGASHSFNGTSGNCAGANRTGTSAYEPGSGVTIMSYAGGCTTDNLATSTSGNFRFHLMSLRQMLGHLDGFGRCYQSLATTNNPPTVDGGPDYVIPRATPFELRATGSDPDAADAANLTWVWEQADPGINYSNPPYTDIGDPQSTTRPLFRSFAPVSSPARVFPSLSYILNNANVPPDTVGGFRTAESLPAIGRTLNFGVTLRDNRSSGGGMADDSVTLTVAGNAGPFQVTAPNSAVTWAGGSTQTVTWSVANTASSPVSCSQVRISLSTDGGVTFPIILSGSTANDGTESILVPAAVSSAQARIRVEAVGNIFFDISDTPFAITSGGTTTLPTIAGFTSSPTVPVANTSFGGTITGTNFVSGGTQVWFCLDGTTSCNAVSATAITVSSPTSLALSGVRLTGGNWIVYVQTAAGASNRSTAFTVSAATSTAPTVTSFSWNPSSPIASQPFAGTINGSNFVSGATRVFFCSTGVTTCTELAAASLGQISATSLSITSVTLGIGTWQVYVQTAVGPSNRSTTFSVGLPLVQVPTISVYSWTPAAPIANESFGGTITGTGFEIGATSLFFCPEASTTCSQVPAGSINVSSQTSISLSGVSLTGGAWQFYVQTAAGTSGRSTSFTVDSGTSGSPTIGSYTWNPVSPTSGRSFGGTIIGTNFATSGMRIYFCQIGKPFCQQQSASSITVIDKTRLTVSNIVLTTGSWQFYLLSPGGISSRSSVFSVQTVVFGLPTIASLALAPASPAPNTPFNIAVTGTNFVTGGTRAFICSDSTDSCTEFSSGLISVPFSTRLIVEQVSLGAGSWQLYLQTSSGVSGRSTPFQIGSTTQAVPVITSLARNPASPIAGQPFTLTVSGTGFVSGATRLFLCLNGAVNCTEAPLTSINVSGTTSLIVSNVSLASGSWQVYLQTAVGVSARSAAFTIQSPAITAPTISGYLLNPAAPVAGQPFSTTITGTGFVVGATQVYYCVNGNSTCSQFPAASVQVTNATSISLTGVSLVAGAWQFYVQTTGGPTERSTAFLVTSAPALDLPTLTGFVWNPINPDAGQPFSGTISGTNFVTGSTSVIFCLEATTTCVQAPSDSISVTSPTGIRLTGISLASGRWQVYVQTVAGASNRSNVFQVTVQQGTFPKLTGYILTPTVPRTNIAFTGTITGTNFEAARTSVFFCLSGSSTCTQVPSQNVTVVSGTSLTFTNFKLQRGSWQVYLQTSVARTDRSRAFLVM